MAKYEFGIMENPPVKGKRYDDYDPENYPRLTAIEDDIFDPVLLSFRGTVYWHTLDEKADAIAMAGINLIPPESSAVIAEALAGNAELRELKELLSDAVKEDKFVILFGL